MSVMVTVLECLWTIVRHGKSLSGMVGFDEHLRGELATDGDLLAILSDDDRPAGQSLQALHGFSLRDSESYELGPNDTRGEGKDRDEESYSDVDE